MGQLAWRRALAIGLLMIGEVSVATAQTLYDDFAGTQLNPNLWAGTEQILQRPGSLDSVRTVKAGRLWLGTSQAGNLGTGAQTASSRHRVRAIAAGGNNLGMGASFQLLKAEAQGCAQATTAPAEARVGINALLFNDGSSNVSSDQTGDVGVTLMAIQRSDLNRPIAEGALVRCTNSSCTVTETLMEASGIVQAGAILLLAWQWEPSSNAVAVRVNDGVVTLPYTQTPVRILDYRAIEAWAVVPGCMEGARSSATALSAVDDVFVIP
jgi:hypothetical protein